MATSRQMADSSMLATEFLEACICQNANDAVPVAIAAMRQALSLIGRQVF